MRQIYLDQYNADNHINKISMYTPAAGYIAFENFLGYTQDSGHTFLQKPITTGNVNYNGYSVNLTFGFGIAGVKAFNHDTLLAYGDYGLVPAILYSVNAGASFTLVFHSQFNSMELRTGITSMLFPENSNIGYATDADRILKTVNRGQTWSAIRTDPGSYFDYLEATDDNSIAAFSTGYNTSKLLKSTNAGTSWQQVTLPAGNRIEYCTFLTPAKGWLHGRDDNNGENFFYTQNAGLTWTQKNDGHLTPAPGVEMHFINDSTGYMIGGYTVFKTSDSGKIWEPLPRDNNYSYLGYGHNTISFSTNSQFWAGGGHGFLELTTNGGGATLPKSFFKIDSAGYYVAGAVQLKNYSKPASAYKWYVNGILQSTAYNASYIHNLNHPCDTVSLIVIKSNFSDTSFQYQCFTPPPPPPAPYTGWELKPTNINDDLLDVRAYGNDAVMIGKKGFYYTHSGMETASSWIRLRILNNSADSIKLTNIKFCQLAFDDKSTVFYAAGTDTVNHKAVILKFNTANLAYSFLYTGSANSAFNTMVMTDTYYASGILRAAGDNGLVLYYNLSNGDVNVQNPGGTESLRHIYYRYGNSLPSSIGASSASSVYVLDANSAAVTASHLLPYVPKGSVGQSSFADMHVTDSTLYVVRVSSGFFAQDSVVKIKKPAGLVYNNISGAVYGTAKYIATNMGIYRLNYSGAIIYGVQGDETIEYQPTSLRKNISNIWFKESSLYDTGYAVGPAGTLMKTVNLGGPSVPYASITSTGNCLGAYTALTGYHGTATTCAWYADNNFVNNSCNSFILFATPGLHQLKYIVSNIYGMADTAYKTVSIKPVPAVNLQVVLNDTILCKSEPVTVQISNTQAGYRYEFIEKGTNIIYGGAGSTGGLLSFITAPVNHTAWFSIRVTDTAGGCSAAFTDSVHVNVEHTRSVIAVDRLNMSLTDNENYFARSPESNSYYWTFHEDASITNSVSASPQNIHYTQSGQKTATLISESAYGCRDTITSNTVFVYAKPSPAETCFAENMNGASISDNTLNAITKNNDNSCLILGTMTDTGAVVSRYGQMKSLTANSSYLAKMTTDGVLQFVHYISNNEGTITVVTADNNGNLYIGGRIKSTAFYHFNNGDSIRIYALPADTTYLGAKYNGFLMKVDSMGHYLWHTILYDKLPNWQGYSYVGAVVNKIAVRNNHVVLTASFKSELDYYRNGQATHCYSFTPSGYAFDNTNTCIMSLNTDGTLNWKAYFNENYNNYRGVDGIGVDNAGNTYVSGIYEQRITAYNSDSSLVYNLIGQTAYERGYVFKYNPSGVLQWNNVFRTSYQYGDLNRTGMVNDDAGNLYLNISSMSFGLPGKLLSYHSNGTVAGDSLCGFGLVKLNTNGEYIWGRGSKFPYYGYNNNTYLKGADLYSIGKMSLNSDQSATFILSSTDGQDRPVNTSRFEYFTANYDTSGKIKRVLHSGPVNNGSITGDFVVADDDGNFITAGNVTNNNSAANTVFGVPIHHITNNNGYFAKLNPNFCLNVLPPAANAGRDTLICKSQPVTLGTTAVSGNTYSWTSSPAGFTSSAASPTVTPTATTSYYLTVANAAGAVAADTVIVSISAVTANAGPDQTICPGSNTVIGTTAVPSFNYSWTSQPAGFTSSLASPAVQPGLSAEYYLVVTNSLGCTARDTIIINVSLPPANAGADLSICAGASAVIGSAGISGYTYSWSSLPAGFVSASAAPLVSPAVTTTYLLAVSNNNCTAYDTVTVNVVPLTVADAGPDHSYCSAEAVSISLGTAAIAGYTYSWASLPAGYISSDAQPAFAPPATTYFYLTVSSNGCYKRDTALITVIPSPYATAGPDKNTCAGTPVNIGAAATGNFVYGWTSLPAGFISASANPQVSPLVTTVYYLTVSNGTCTSYDTVTVNAASSLSTNAGPDGSICRGNSYTIGTPGSGYQYSWTSSPAGFSANTATAVVHPNVTTSYYLNVTNGTCSGHDTLIVNVASAAAANAGPDLHTCSAIFAGVIGTPAVSGAGYQWTPITGLSAPNTAQPIATVAANTLYKLVLTQNGCSTYDSVMLSVNQCTTPLLFNDSISICSGTSVVIGTAGQPGYTYEWTSTPAYIQSTFSNPGVTPLVNTLYRLVRTETATQHTDTGFVRVNPVACSGSEGGYTVYPNPAGNYVMVAADRPTAEHNIFELVDAQGIVVLRTETSYRTLVDISRLASGVYFHHLLRGKEMIKGSGKLIIQH